MLLPTHDGLADLVEARLAEATVRRYAVDAESSFSEVTFFCLPYLGAAVALELLPRLPRLRVVQSLSSGVDDVLAALPAGVTLCNGRGLHHEESTAELAVALILASLRQLPNFVLRQQQAVWEHSRTDTLDGKRVLLVGRGVIAREIEQRLLPFGAQVRKVSRTAGNGVEPLSRLRNVAGETDVLVVCIALTDETRGLVDARVLAALPDGALVVNVARGPVIDAVALQPELTSGRLAAALDVSDPEPLPAVRLEWSLPNVLVTPHIGGDTIEFARRTGPFLIDQVRRHLGGVELRNVVIDPG